MGLVAKILSVIEVLFPSFCFGMLFPFLPPLLNPLFPPAPFSRTLQRHPPLRSEVATKPSCSLFRYADFNICFVDGSSERGEKDASKITTYPPGAVRFDCELRAVQVSCGFHHSGRLISLMTVSGQAAWYVCLHIILRTYWKTLNKRGLTFK